MGVASCLAIDLDVVRPPDPLPARSPDPASISSSPAGSPPTPRCPSPTGSGLLLLCCGQTLTRLVRLRTDDVVVGVEGVSIRFGRTELMPAESIGTLVAELANRPAGRATTGVPDDSPWLFAGALPGRPLGTDALGLRVAAYGIDARAARNTLLLDLGSELAPVILADLFGMRPGTAVRWAKAGGGPWARYAAARARRRLHARTDEPTRRSYVGRRRAR